MIQLNDHGWKLVENYLDFLKALFGQKKKIEEPTEVTDYRQRLPQVHRSSAQSG